MTARKLVYLPLDKIAPATRNAKSHNTELVRASVSRFGFVEPVVLDERTGRLVAGHGRRDELLARKAAGDPPPDGVRVSKGEWLIPVVCGWSSTDDAEAEAAGIALNQSTIAGGWDDATLVELLNELAESDSGLDGLGFDQVDLDELIRHVEFDARVALEGDPDVVPEVPTVAVTKPGDLWTLGEHRLLCGDCRVANDVARVLDGRKVNVAFTSPPYADQRTYDESSGFLPIVPSEYVEWFAPVAANVVSHLADDGSWFVNIKSSAEELDTDLYVLDLVVAHAREWGWHFATEFCWEKRAMPVAVTRRFKNAFESVFQFARNDWKIRPDAVSYPSELVPTGGGRPNWQTQGQPGIADTFVDRGPGWAYPSNRLPSFAGSNEAIGHSAAFPVGLPAWFTRAYSDPGDVIFDPFMGSGSTLIAAHQEGRVGVGIEISPAYCDVICARFQRVSGIVPLRDGQPHDFLAE